MLLKIYRVLMSFYQMILVVIIRIPWAVAHALWYGRNLCSTLPWSCHLGILDKMMEHWDTGSIKWLLYSKVTGKLIRSWTPSLCELPQLICDKKHFSPSWNTSLHSCEGWSLSLRKQCLKGQGTVRKFKVFHLNLVQPDHYINHHLAISEYLISDILV